MARAKEIRTIKPVPEMAEDIRAERVAMQENSMSRDRYKGLSSDADMRLSVMIKNRADALRNAPRVKVNFQNIEDVKQRTYDYLDACAIASTYPTIIGLAVHGFGVSKQAVYNHMSSYPDSPTTAFLRMISDFLADILINDALRRKCDCVSSIFVLKNLYGFRDNAELPVPDVVDNEEKATAQEYLRKYGDILKE